MMRRILILLILIAPLGILFPFLQDFPFPPLSNYSDLAISHYPNAIYLMQSLRDWQQIPLWSNTILSGYPFGADPLSGLWYLPGWFAYIFPLPLGLNLDVLLHLLLGGVGVFFYLRKENKSDFSALAGAFIFELFSKTFAHYAAGHLTLVYAVAWTPWIFLCEKYFRKGRSYFLSGIILGLAALADVRWFAFLLSAWVVFAIYVWWLEKDGKILRLIIRIVISTALATLIAAPLIVPLIEFTRLTTRSTLTPVDNLALALPPSYLANLIIPNFQAYAEWVVYPGGVALILTIFGLSRREFRKKNIFYIGTILFSLLIALGSTTPVATLLFQLPGFDLLRVPSRIIFLLGWAFAILAADEIDYLIKLRTTEKGKKLPGSGLAIVAVSGFLLLIGFGLWIYTGVIPFAYLWGICIIPITTILVLLRRSDRISGRNWVFVMLVLICLDLGEVNFSNIHFRPAAEVLQAGEPESSIIGLDKGELFRVYSPSYSLPQQTAATNYLELADGINPLQLNSYVAYMQNATGIPFSGYSVTLPPFRTAQPEIDNQGYIPDTKLLGQLNVKYIVSSFPINDLNLVFQEKVGNSQVYMNKDYRPRAWIQSNLDPANPDFSQVTWLTWSPNKIEVQANHEGWLVFSEIDYPGWFAAIDGKPVEIARFNNILRSVHLPTGEHTVDLEFRPTSVYMGIGLSILGWLICGGNLLLRGKKW
jgi:Bacterial membrane protein YfhO